MDYKTIATVGKVETHVEDKVAVITLADPPGNGVGKQVTDRILELLDQYEADDGVRCIMFTHEGPDFSSCGAGAEEFELINKGLSMVEVSGYFRDSGRRLVKRIDEYPKPTLSVGKGACMGAAYTLFSCPDIRIAGESLTLFNPDFYMGIASDWGLTGSRLPLWLGRNRMLDLNYLGDEMTARDLYNIGAISKVVPDDMLAEEGMRIARKMARTSPLVVRYFKEDLRRVIYGGALEGNVAKEVEDADIVLATEDSRLGSQAFTNGTYYEFQGR